MTRFLSESLQAPEPSFRLQLRQLERVNGSPSADIRLSTDVAQLTRQKIKELGLDPHDTTPKELYLALQSHLIEDDKRVNRLLRTRAATHVSAEGEVIAGLAHILRESQQGQSVYALKPARFKQLLKKSSPKRVMKQLGYRSIDSLIRHEQPALILTAAQFVEGKGWWHDLLAQYKRLTPQDFEMRGTTILQPNTSRWRELSASVVAHTKHNVYCLKELGALVLLPLPADAPVGATMASLMLALQSLSDLKSSSTYLRLAQVRSDFGAQVQTVVSGEPELQTSLLDQAVPWRLIQRSLSKLPEGLHQELLEPHLQSTDLTFKSLGESLSSIESSLSFWQGTEFLGLLHDGKPVSLHALDVALNLCNRLSFEQRLVHNFQTSLWHELLLRYLQPQTLEHTLLTALQPKLSPVLALNRYS